MVAVLKLLDELFQTPVQQKFDVVGAQTQASFTPAGSSSFAMGGGTPSTSHSDYYSGGGGSNYPSPFSCESNHVGIVFNPYTLSCLDPPPGFSAQGPVYTQTGNVVPAVSNFASMFQQRQPTPIPVYLDAPMTGGRGGGGYSQRGGVQKRGRGGGNRGSRSGRGGDRKQTDGGNLSSSNSSQPMFRGRGGGSGFRGSGIGGNHFSGMGGGGY